MSRSKGRHNKKSDKHRKSDKSENEMSSTWIYGFHAIKQLLENSPGRVLQILIQTGRDDERSNILYQLSRDSNIEIKRISNKELDAKFHNANHQGFVAEIEPAKVQNETFLENLLIDNDKPFLLILDQIQDPHNLGAILRSAAAAGVDAVIAPNRNACGLTGAVRKVAVGAAEIVPYVQVTNLARILRFLHEQGVYLVGLAGEASSSIFASEVTGALAVVMGNEAKGLRRLTGEHCDVLVKIPMSGAIESLNVSVATGISLFHYAGLRS